MATDEKVTLRQKTFHLLRNRPATIKLKDIAEASDLPLSWIKCFHLRGNKNSASVDKVEKLYEHLTGTSLL